MTRTIQEIEEELKQARAIAEAEQQAKRDAVKPIWEYTITRLPTAATHDWDPIYDPTIAAYKLDGQVINREECLAAGHPDFALRGGGMRYLFNTGTGRLIGPTGGGRIFLGLGWNKPHLEVLEQAIADISQFLVDHPDGGDITAIIQTFRDATEE